MYRAVHHDLGLNPNSEIGKAARVALAPVVPLAAGAHAIGVVATSGPLAGRYKPKGWWGLRCRSMAGALAASACIDCPMPPARACSPLSRTRSSPAVSCTPTGRSATTRCAVTATAIRLRSSRGKPKRRRLLPHVHQVVSLLKRSLLGTHHGAATDEHLDYYLDEFTFRFNRRRSRSRGKPFFRLVQQAVAVAPAPYESLVKYAILPPSR